MTTRAGSIFEVTIAEQSLPEDLQLRNIEWGVLFAVDGQRTSGEIFRMLNLTEEEGADILERLQDYELIREKALNYKQYIAAQARAKEDRSQTLAEFLFGGSLLASAAAGGGKSVPTPPPPPEEVAVVETPSSAPSAQPPEPARSQATEKTTAPAPPRPTFQPLQAPPKAPATPKSPQAPDTMTATVESRRLSLKNVIDFIIQNATDLNAGQLDVYRVFIRVNTQLLKRNGIHSLRFTDDRVITDPELQQAILHSVDRTLGISCPDDVFV